MVRPLTPWTIVVALVAVAVSALVSAADLTRPEATVATFYTGVLSGDKALSESTFLQPKTMNADAFRASPIIAFHIVTVAPARGKDTFARPGDIEVLVDVDYRTRPQS